MTTARIRRVLRIGGSLAIVLPSSWVKGRVKGRVKAGEEIVVIGNGELRVIPVHLKESAAKEDKT